MLNGKKRKKREKEDTDNGVRKKERKKKIENGVKKKTKSENVEKIEKKGMDNGLPSRLSPFKMLLKNGGLKGDIGRD